MLLGQERCRNQDSHLPASLNRLEGGPHGELSLTVPDITADQSIHRPGLLHVLLDGPGHLYLVLCIVVREGGLELALPFTILLIGRAGMLQPGRLDIEQFRRQVHQSRLDLVFLA